MQVTSKDYGDPIAIGPVGYQPKPCFIVPSKWGRWLVRVHDAETVGIGNVDGLDVARSHGRDYRGPGEVNECLTLRGIDYRVSASMSIATGELSYWNAYRVPSMTPVSDAARRDLKEAAKGAAGVVLARTPGVTVLAQCLTLADDQARAVEARNEARAALEKAEKALEDARTRLLAELSAAEAVGADDVAWLTEARMLGGA